MGNAATAHPPVSVLEQRLYHVTHLSNLPGILASTALRAGAAPVFDIAADDLRSERATTPAPGASGRALDEYVPFFLSPDAGLWLSLREGAAHPRLGARAASAEPADFVFLVTTLRQVVDGDLEIVAADGNAEGTYTRFAVGRDEIERMLGRLRADAGADALLEAEFLVFGEVPIELVGLIGVGNDKVRSTVRELLDGLDYAPKISVYPPWFQRTA